MRTDGSNAESRATAESPASVASRRILLCTFGSFGDLHPFLALGLELAARGHRPVIATNRHYREKVEAEGLGFCPIRPHLPEGAETRAEMAKIMDGAKGSEYIIRRVLMPAVREQYEDLLAAAEQAEFLVSHPITYPGPLVAGKLGLRWAAAVLQPMLFFSATDPPVPPGAEGMARLLRVNAAVSGFMMGVVKDRMREWAAPVDALRAELGLPPADNPIFDGQFSPYLNLALFSPLLGPPQADWPAHTVATGFPFYDRFGPGAGTPDGLREFLDAGPPPVVFTLGSSAVMLGSDFYRESLEVVRRLGCRAVFLAGEDDWHCLPKPLPPEVFLCAYAPHSEVFPRAAAIVHQGGAGTTGQALRAGRPMLVVPFAHDQPDHAHRIVRLGLGSYVPRGKYTASRVTRELGALLKNREVAHRAEEVGRRVRDEAGVVTACDAIEQAMTAEK